MESIVILLITTICLSFLLKQSFNNLTALVVTAAAVALFVGAMWPQAIEQSKTQITSWLHNPELMLDTSVIITVDVVLTLSYCILAAYIATTGEVKRSVVWCYRLLRWFPGIMILPSLFSALVYMIFALPGYSFPLISWSFAAALFVATITIVYALREILYEKELRLELLFLTNILIAILGIVATVNGRTAMRGESSVDLYALGGVILIVAVVSALGIVVRRIKIRRVETRLLTKKTN